MNGYVAFYKKKRVEVYAPTIAAAKVLAAKEFRAKRLYEVAVVLAEKDGEEVVHVAVD